MILTHPPVQSGTFHTNQHPECSAHSYSHVGHYIPNCIFESEFHSAHYTGRSNVWLLLPSHRLKAVHRDHLARRPIGISWRFRNEFCLSVRPAHRRISPIVTAMILGVGVQVFGAMRIVLQHRDCADRINARRKAEYHRFGIGRRARSDHARPELIPAAHRPGLARATHSRDTGVIGRAESRDAFLDQLGVDALGATPVER